MPPDPQQQQTFSNVTPIPQTFDNVTPIDSPGGGNAVEQPSALDSFWKSTFLGKAGTVADEVAGWAKKKADANRQENLTAVAQGKEPPHGEAANTFLDSLSSYGKLESASTRPKNLAIAGGVAAANTNPLTGIPVDAAMLVHGAAGVKENLPAAIQGNPEAVESALLSGSEAVGGAAGIGGQAGAVPGAIRSGWRTIGNPMGLASTGQELLTQGISPRTSMTGFKSSLDRASGDLAKYNADSPIKSVQDLNDAIPEIKKKIWDEEVEPALQRQADKPVNMQPVANAVRKQISPEMREFDEGNAGKLDLLATKLENAKDVTSASSLLKYVNGQLESYFQKFPAARKANLMNNPETAGWEAARAELRNQFLGTLEDNGEAGVREARLRYGAMDTLQDAVERRVNVADRAKPMSLGRIVGIAGAIPTGGLSIAAGELSNYLNRPDVLVRRGIGKLQMPAEAPRYSLPQPISTISAPQTPQAPPNAPILAQTGTFGPRGPQPPANLQGSPGMFNNRAAPEPPQDRTFQSSPSVAGSTQAEVESAVHSGAADMALKQLDADILKEKNPSEKARLLARRKDLASGNY